MEDATYSRRAWQRMLEPDLLGRLAEAGFLASECGLHQEAERIFRGLAGLKPGRPSPLTALAMVHARRGLVSQAIAELRVVLTHHPESEMAKAVLATLLLDTQQPGALALFEEVLASAQDASAVKVAQCSIVVAREQERDASESADGPLATLRSYNRKH